ncbi:hypothetical protein BaRGS_00040108 [Batillaria attramentaria]|uniref:Multivesicular body subunit 12A n=1 Tax=Batillaria attramentaria TaxID=370345 RepID=A0ABD0J1C3_9CAEN
MDSSADLPITGVCVVSDPSKAPPNYTVIDRTFDRSEDADLWKDGLFGRRTMRYLCVERSIPDMTKDVLIDVAFINERDPPPPGFTVIENTHDTGEKALKKKLLCARWMLPSMTNDAITELIFLSRASRKPPLGYTLVGETNNMSLCYKMGKLSKPATTAVDTPQGYASPAYNLKPLGSSLPYTVAGYQPPSGMATVNRSGPPMHGASGHSNSVTPLSGIPWQLNPRFQTLTELQKLTIPEIKYKSMMDIENEYKYDFRMERQAARIEPERT